MGGVEDQVLTARASRLLTSREKSCSSGKDIKKGEERDPKRPQEPSPSERTGTLGPRKKKQGGRGSKLGTKTRSTTGRVKKNGVPDPHHGQKDSCAGRKVRGGCRGRGASWRNRELRENGNHNKRMGSAREGMKGKKKKKKKGVPRKAHRGQTRIQTKSAFVGKREPGKKGN